MARNVSPRSDPRRMLRARLQQEAKKPSSQRKSEEELRCEIEEDLRGAHEKLLRQEASRRSTQEQLREQWVADLAQCDSLGWALKLTEDFLINVYRCSYKIPDDLVRLDYELGRADYYRDGKSVLELYSDYAMQLHFIEELKAARLLDSHEDIAKTRVIARELFRAGLDSQGFHRWVEALDTGDYSVLAR